MRLLRIPNLNTAPMSHCQTGFVLCLSLHCRDSAEGTAFADLGKAMADVLCHVLLCGWGSGDVVAEFSLIPL